MSNNLTIDDFAEKPTPEQLAQRNANAEIKDEVGKFKNKIQAEIRALKNAKRKENRPVEQASLEQQIAEKQQDINDVDCVFLAMTSARQAHFKRLINWDGIMKKHLGGNPAPTTPATPATPPTPTGEAS